MELNMKIQELRKQRGLTQEELAQHLYVSRTAVSKWESGRGYPSIDSLKALSRFFHISIDDLLSSDELLTVAEADVRRRSSLFLDRVFGLADCSTVLFFLLPFFAQKSNGSIRAVPLLSLVGLSPRLKALYLLIPIAMMLLGAATLVIRSGQHPRWLKHKRRASLLLNAAGVLLFIAGLQPYAAAYLFVFLMIKAALPAKKP